MRIHTDVKEHVCPIEGCGSAFHRKDNMREHYKSHLKKSGMPQDQIDQELEKLKCKPSVKAPVRRQPVMTFERQVPIMNHPPMPLQYYDEHSQSWTGAPASGDYSPEVHMLHQHHYYAPMAGHPYASYMQEGLDIQRPSSVPLPLPVDAYRSTATSHVRTSSSSGIAHFPNPYTPHEEVFPSQAPTTPLVQAYPHSTNGGPLSPPPSMHDHESSLESATYGTLPVADFSSPVPYHSSESNLDYANHPEPQQVFLTTSSSAPPDVGYSDHSQEYRAASYSTADKASSTLGNALHPRTPSS